MNVLPDPNVKVGPFRVLPYAPGGFVIHDERRALGEGGVATAHSIESAVVIANAMLGQERNLSEYSRGSK